MLRISEHHNEDEVFHCFYSFNRYEKKGYSTFSSIWEVVLTAVCFPDICHLKGQERIKEFEHIFLRLSFPSFYNSYNKACCKLYPGGCYRLMDSSGYTCELLKGRVTKIENDGWIEFRIANVQLVDGGFYRCVVLGAPNHIYRDYYVEVSGEYSYKTFDRML